MTESRSPNREKGWMQDVERRLAALERSPQSTLFAGFDGDTVAADEARTSTSYGDLSTVGPVATVEVGRGGRMVVMVSAHMVPGENSDGRMAYDIDGPTDRAPSDDRSAVVSGQAPSRGAYFHIEEDLAPGTYTVTAKYRKDGVSTSVSFRARELIVIPF